MPSKKKRTRKIGAANEPSTSSVKKSQKKQSAGPGAKYLPVERIRHYSQSSAEGHVTLSVPSDFATVSLTYDPKSVRLTFSAIFEGFLQHVEKRLSHTFQGSATGLDVKVTGISLKKKVTELPNEVASSVDIAMAVFNEKIVYALHSFSDQLLLQIIISTLNELQRIGHIKLSGSFNMREVWGKYLASYEKAMKAHWASMTPGQRVKWPPMRLRELAKAHKLNEVTARRLRSIYTSKASRRWREGEWKDEVRRQCGSRYDWILDDVHRKKERVIALLITSNQFGLYESNIKDGMPGIIKRLEQAKRLTEKSGQTDDHISPFDEDAPDSNFTILEDD
jgi:hypothetical protein